MNTLPLVFTFLMIFSMIALTFVREAKSSRITEKAIASHDDLSRKIHNHLVSKTYKNDGKRGYGGAGSSKKKQIFASRRVQFPPAENSKFNLCPLTQQEGELKFHPLYELSASLLKDYYGEKIFKHCPRPEKMEHRMLEAIIARAKVNPDAQNLADLAPEDSILANAYYQMLKGTNQYDMQSGVPPFGDLFVFTKDKFAFSFASASPGILKGVFGPEIAKQIMDDEKKICLEKGKNIPFSKENLSAVLASKPILFAKYSPIEPFIDFAVKRHTRNEIGGKDDKIGLSLRAKNKGAQ